MLCALDYLFFLVLILLTGSIWVRQVDFDININILRVVALLIPLIVFSLKVYLYPKTRIEGAAFCCGIIAVCMAVMFLVPGGSFNSTILFFAPMLAFLAYAYSFRSKEDIKRSLRRFVNLVTIIAAVSLFFFVFGSVFHLIRPSGTVQFEWDWTRSAATYNFLYYEPQKTYMLGYEGVRNCAIFTEAPMFVFILVCALGIQVLFLKSSKPRSIILLATIITTFSTTGYVAIFLVYILKFWIESERKPSMQKIRLFFVPAMIICIALMVAFFLDDKSSTGSYDIRTDHLAACWNVFFDSFPFGCGLGNVDHIFSYTLFDQGIAVGLPYLFAESGIIGIGLVFGPIAFALLKSRGIDRKRLLAMAAVLVWLLFCTSLHFNSMIEWWLLEVLFLRYPLLPQEEGEASTSK